MTDYFSQYSGIAGHAADQYGIPQPVFYGLIQTESSWNPFAHATTTSATGFGQITNATAQTLGINASDPVQNLYGSAAYLASMPGSTLTEKLAHYYQGPNATINSSGLAYAAKVMQNAAQYMNGGSSNSSGGSSIGGYATAAAQISCKISGLLSAVPIPFVKAAGDAGQAACAAGSAAGVPGLNNPQADQCGPLDFVCKLKQWIDSSGFFERLALAFVALIFILGAIYVLKGKIV